MKSAKKSIIQIAFIVFLIAVFIAGIFVCLNGSIQSHCSTCSEGMSNYINNPQAPPVDDMDKMCPNTLMKRGNQFILFNTNLPETPGSNPIIFNSLDGYIQYLEEQKTKGVHCPVLYLQQESDAQGNDVFRMRPSPFQMEGGLQTMPMFDANGVTPIKVVDATTEDPNYNQNQYPSFDPMGQYIGKFTNIDKIHYSTQKDTGKSSENPMDPNWGGLIFTQSAVQSGKYDDNNVGKVVYPK